ncbi:VanZ family protein [Reichenbachiella sp.]
MVIGWTGAILFATLSPSDGDPLFEIPIPHFDKVAHFGLFMIHAVFVGLSQDLRKGLVIGILSGISLGLFTEWMQSYVPGRHTDIYDGLADVCGTLFGLLLVYIVRSRESAT